MATLVALARNPSHIARMTFLPIVDRELRVAATRRATFTARWVAVLLGTLVGGFFLFGWGVGLGFSGRSTFWNLAYLLWFLGVLESARGASDSLSEERREGTLGLLFLTGLRAHDVVLGKAVAHSLQRFLAVLSVAPLLVLAVPVGGVTGGEIIRVLLAVGGALTTATAVATMISSFSREPVRAFMVAAGSLAALCLLPFGIGLLLQVSARAPGWASLGILSPLMPILTADDFAYRSRPAAFWLSMGCGIVVSAVCFAVACWQTPRAFQERSQSRRATGAAAKVVTTPARRRRTRPLAESNPVDWLYTRHAREDWPVWAVLCVVLVGAAALAARESFLAQVIPFVTGGVVLLLRWGIKVGLAIQVSRQFAALREQDGVLQIVLGTTLSDRELLRGLWRSVLVRWRGPVALALTLQTVPVILWVLAPESIGATTPAGPSATGIWFGYAAGPIIALLGVASFVTDLLALFWAGGRFALRSGRPHAAAFKSLLLVQFLPSVLCCGVTLVTNLIFWIWGWSELQRGLRSPLQLSGGQGRLPAG